MSTRKSVKKYRILFDIGILWAITYATFSYIFVEINPLEWHGFWRFVFAALVLWLLVLLLIQRSD